MRHPARKSKVIRRHYRSPVVAPGVSTHSIAPPHATLECSGNPANGIHQFPSGSAQGIARPNLRNRVRTHVRRNLRQRWHRVVPMPGRNKSDFGRAPGLPSFGIALSPVRDDFRGVSTAIALPASPSRTHRQLFRSFLDLSYRPAGDNTRLSSTR